MSATSRDAIPESADQTLRFESSVQAESDPTEDLANEVTSELNTASQWPRPATRAPIGLGISGIEPIGMASVVTVGTVLRERYVLERQLAYGGTAMIFRAHDLRRDATAAGGPRVAVKLLQPALQRRPQHIARLQREFRQTQALAHSNIVRFHDLDCDRGTWFIVMELLVGETLGPRLRRCAPAPMPKEEALCIAEATAEALAFAHAHGVTHGDVKPDNVYLTAGTGVRVLDFGVAPDSLPGTFAGNLLLPDATGAAATRAYASPQVLAGERPEPRDDVFSLACVVYEMLTGRHPWGRRGADAARSAGMAVEPPPVLSADQWAALCAAIAWEREPRPDMLGLIRALREEIPTPRLTPDPASPIPSLPPEPVPAAAVAAQSVSVAVPRAEETIAAVKPPARTTGRWPIAVAAGLAFLLGALINRFDGESPNPSPQALPASAAPGSDVADAAPLPAQAPGATVEAPGVATLLETPAAVAPQATAPRPGFVAFESETMAVSSRAVVAAIPVRHFAGASRRVEVGWRLLGGSAVAGRDYGGPESGVARFAEGHTFRIIFVPITIDTSVAEDRTFAVELTDASPGGSLGAMRRMLVTIVDDA